MSLPETRQEATFLGAPPRWRWWVGGFALTIIAYSLLSAALDVQGLGRALDPAFGYALVLAIGFGTAGFAVRAARWHAVLGFAGSPVPWRTSVPNFLVGLGMGLTPGKAAELLKIHYLRRRQPVPVRTGVASIIGERVGDGIGVLTLVGIAATDWRVRSLALGGALVLIAALAIASLRTAPKDVSTPPSRTGLLAALQTKLRRLVEAVRPLLRPTPLFVVSITGLFAWVLETTGMLIVANALGLEITWMLCAFAYGVGSILGFLSFLPGGIGVTEFGVTAILVASGIPAADAVLLTLGVRTATLWWGIAVGGVALAALNVRAKHTVVAAPVLAADPD